MSAAAAPSGLSQAFLAIRNLRALAAFLGFPLRRMTFLLYGPAKGHLYREFAIRKRNGDPRKILAPIKPLKIAQRRLSAALYEIHRPRSCVYGFVNERSIVDNARCHVGHRWLLRADLEDFFPTINFGRVRGLFLAAPFSFPPPVATALAQLTIHENELPQGAPTSPILSNYICHRLDYDLISLAQRHKCYYTRYADDLIFSGNQRLFPKDLCSLDTSGTSMKATAGDELRSAVESAGFRINKHKVTLKQRNSRQLCTGLVVNTQSNVRREYVREIRALLHMWRKFGLTEAGKRFFSELDKKTRVVASSPDSFRFVVRGKIQFLGFVKGWNDPVYIRLAATLVALDDTFQPKTIVPLLTKGKIRVLAEGKTDYDHLKAALSAFHSRNLYVDLQLDLSPPIPSFEGDTDLLYRCKIYANSKQAELVVCVFDRDVPNMLSQISDGSTPFKSWGNRVYSLAIPIPTHRNTLDRVCIEMYYQDKDLKRVDEDGRRLFLRQEFNDKGFNDTGELKMENPKNKKLVVEETVYEWKTQRSVALSKATFAKYIVERTPPFDGVDFEAFREVFALFNSIRQIDAKAAP
jgi:RNA-directed DNA polymerase